MDQSNGLATVAREQSNALALVREQWSDDQIKFVQETVARGATKPEAVMFLARCAATGLDPYDRQIYCIVRGKDANRQVTIQVGVDGLRTIAERTGEYVGSSEPEYEMDGQSPTLARVTVTREIRGKDRQFTGVARWSEFYPGDALGFMWKKMPFHMLGKAAEAQALRKAFPREMAGVETHEEARGDESFVVSTTVREMRTPDQLERSSAEYERLFAEQAESDTKATQPALGAQAETDARTFFDKETGEVIEIQNAPVGT